MTKKRKPIRLTLVRESNLTSLTSKVNELLKFGWELQGGVSVDFVVDEFLYTQTMIKERLDV